MIWNNVQISPVSPVSSPAMNRWAIRVGEDGVSKQDVKLYVEGLIVRQNLACLFIQQLLSSGLHAALMRLPAQLQSARCSTRYTHSCLRPNNHKICMLPLVLGSLPLLTRRHVGSQPNERASPDTLAHIHVSFPLITSADACALCIYDSNTYQGSSAWSQLHSFFHNLPIAPIVCSDLTASKPDFSNPQTNILHPSSPTGDQQHCRSCQTHQGRGGQLRSGFR